MCLIGVSNLKEIDLEKVAKSYFLNWCEEEEERYEENQEIFRNVYLPNY